ncbi:50S ribosomal protein L6 [Candidatus Roizmanbacteria bacterium]|nr:50S ribosomal protein L6 [Candidatus Roizmanbacteria bacterium]
MSKIGEKVITVPASVTVEIVDSTVAVKGSKGEIITQLPRAITVEKVDTELHIKRTAEDKQTRSFHGLIRSLIANAVAGVEKPWEKRMEVVGTGFNVKMQGVDLAFKIGYSHQVIFKKVDGVTFQVEGNNKVIITGADKQKVGQVAYQMKMIRKPDAYKGKGVRYEGEIIKTKAGKKAKAA